MEASLAHHDRSQHGIVMAVLLLRDGSYAEGIASDRGMADRIGKRATQGPLRLLGLGDSAPGELVQVRLTASQASGFTESQKTALRQRFKGCLSKIQQDLRESQLSD
jgi:hypothetical protein